jgi:tripartite-type tricarboxylate transporter receptor subunit TctC
LSFGKWPIAINVSVHKDLPFLPSQVMSKGLSMLDVRKARCACVIALLAGASAQPCAAQPYPSQPVTFVVSFAAGGVADVVARLVAQKLGERGAGKFVVENRGGAGGNLAARVVSTAAADGYTVLATTTALAINATASRNKGYATEDLRAVAIAALASDVMAVHPSSSAKTMQELIGSAGGKGITFGTPGLGTGPHIAAAYFYQEVVKLKAVHVPFSGGAPAVAAAIGNHVDVINVSLPTAQAQIEQGALRGLGIPSPQRSSALPNVPTYGEAGFPNFYSATWVGFFVPAKTPDAVVEKLNADINEILKSPESQQKLKSIGFDPMLKSTAESAEYARNEVALWGKMTRAIGFSTD